MIIQPKIRGFICTTAHPLGCEHRVLEQIEYVKKHKQILTNPPKKVLVIGASTGYGLASRIVAGFGVQAATLGVFLERPADDKRTASAGWYQTAAFEKAAHQAGLYAKSVNGDAFSEEVKQQIIEIIKKDWQGGVDLIVYSLASPRRKHPKTDVLATSVLKPIGKPFVGKTIDVMTGQLSQVEIAPATEEEIAQTVSVMGGEDWAMWIEALKNAGLLAKGVKTLAYSYIGPALTHPIYREGTIGRAKADLQQTADTLNHQLSALEGAAWIAVNKALVTQASAAIPVVPLYISLLYKVMKAAGLHEGCIEQMNRLFVERLYTQKPVPTDQERLIRLDDWEMRPEIQEQISNLWEKVNADNVNEYTDIAGYRQEFYQLFGFEVAGVDYALEVDPKVDMPT